METYTPAYHQKAPGTLDKVYTVTEINARIRGVLESNFPDVWVEGEVSNLKLYPSGHTYLDLKDESSIIPAVLFKSAAQNVKFEIKNGLLVLVHARLSTYIKQGKCQLIISEVEPKALGALQLAFEQLKARLAAEGLFDPARKKPIAQFPERIGIVTSIEGAAIRDILSILKRRFYNLEIIIYPVRVQGDEAKFEIAKAVSDLNREFPFLDVLLVGRGGGSLEDLWAFNEEIVARAISSSRIPVISCVGHETDVTIADFVSDLRAATPSAAAELVVKNKEEVLSNLRQITARLSQSLRNLTGRTEIHLHHLISSRLIPSLRHRLTRIGMNLSKLIERPVFQRPHALYEQATLELDDLCEALVSSFKRLIRNFEKDLHSKFEKLNALSPLACLERGYSITYRFPGKGIIKSSGQAAKGDSLRIRVAKGEIFCDVTSTER